MLRIAIPAVLGVLELLHPTWSDTSVSDAVMASGAWWIPLHVLLIAGDGLLVWTLWPPATAARVVLGVFLVCNTAFLATDGLIVGRLAQADPGAADDLWDHPFVAILANLTGAAWAAALLAVAREWLGPARSSRTTDALVFLTWLAFVAGSVVPLAAVLSRVLALISGASAVYQTRFAGLPFALLVYAAVLRQHVGPEAALGMLCIASATALFSGAAHPEPIEG